MKRTSVVTTCVCVLRTLSNERTTSILADDNHLGISLNLCEQLPNMENYGEWRDVPGIDPGKAKISSEGWVRMQTKGGKIRTLGKPSRGSLTVRGDRRVHMQKKMYLVHRLVAAAFLPPPPSDKHTTVDHIDRNPSHNAVSNLCWATWSHQRLNQGTRARNRTAKAVALTDEYGGRWVFESVADAAFDLKLDKRSISQSARKGCRVGKYRAEYAPVEPQRIDGERWEKWDESLNISSLGRIQRKNDIGLRWGYRFTPKAIKSRSYITMHLKDGTQLLHRMVMLSFTNMDPEKPWVDHINRDTSDNRLENLRWVTTSENMQNRVVSTKGCSRC